MLYGMTYQGGVNNLGVLFEYDPVTDIFIKKLDFDSANGRNPFGSLIQASNGKLYGMTIQGGVNDKGILFEYDPITSTYIKKLEFSGTINGSYPQGSLMQACNGKLYGMTKQGGVNNMGVLFEYNPATDIYTKKLDFNGYNGSIPYYTQLIEIIQQPIFNTTIPDASVCIGGNINFISSAIGNGISYQWQVDDGLGFIDIINNSIYSDVTDDTLHITGATSGMNAYHYRCVVTSTCPIKSIQSDTAILTVNPVYSFTENHTICSGDTFHWQGNDYTIANTYTANYTSINGCDSVYTLNLTVSPVFAFPENHSICNGDTYHWQGNDYAAANTYTANYISINGCDSVYTLNLTVNPVYAFIENHSICNGDTYHWQGNDYTTANTYTANYTSINGCDSIYTLNLTVNPVYAFTENHSICNGDTYHWQGNDYITANTYTANYTSINSCDSVYTLNLSVNTVDTSLIVSDPTITSNASGATFQWLDCDNAFAIIPAAISQSFTALANGNYAVAITQGTCADTSSCVQIISIGIASIPTEEISIFPNPAHNKLTITSSTPQKQTLITIFNMQGQLVKQIPNPQSSVPIEIDVSALSKGIYLVRIQSENGVVNKKLVIQ